MPIFRYRVGAADGSIQAGAVQAPGRNEAADALVRRGYEILLLEEDRSFRSQSGFHLLNRITEKELVVVSRTLSVMVSASVPLVDAVRNIARQSENPRLRFLLNDVATEIEGGTRFSDALDQHVDVFGGFYVNMVRSGETSGQLTDVLEYLADQLEKDYDLNAKIKGAMIYPAFILSGLIVVAGIMMTFVVPKLTQILTEANVPLPLSTRILIVVSGLFAGYWWAMLIGVIGSIAAVRAWISTPSGRYAWDSLKMRIPIFGRLFQQLYVVRFSRSLSTLSKGGVDMVSALEIVSGVMANARWKQLVFETIREVNDGNSIVTAMQRERFVPVMMTQMLGVGEETGRLQEVLQRLAAFFAREIDNLVANMVSLIEPVVMVLLGIGVGVMVSAILLPLYSLSSAV
jgi:type IV pilus assembly protein PilC